MGAGIIRDGVDRSSLLHALWILPLPTHFLVKRFKLLGKSITVRPGCFPVISSI